MDRWIDGTDEQIDRQIDGQIYRWIDRQIGRQIDKNYQTQLIKHRFSTKNLVLVSSNNYDQVCLFINFYPVVKKNFVLVSSNDYIYVCLFVNLYPVKKKLPKGNDPKSAELRSFECRDKFSAKPFLLRRVTKQLLLNFWAKMLVYCKIKS